MKVGDLVEFKQIEPYDRRELGTVLTLAIWHPDGRHKLESPLGPIRSPEPIVEVFWNTGHPGWILKSRIKRVE